MLTEDLNIENQQQVWDRFRKETIPPILWFIKNMHMLCFHSACVVYYWPRTGKRLHSGHFVKLYSKGSSSTAQAALNFICLLPWKRTIQYLQEKHHLLFHSYDGVRPGVGHNNLEDKLISDEESIERNNMISQIRNTYTQAARGYLLPIHWELSFAEIEQLMQINVQSIQNPYPAIYQKVREKFPDYVLYALFLLYSNNFKGKTFFFHK